MLLNFLTVIEGLLLGTLGLCYCDCEEWMEWDPVSSTCIISDLEMCAEANGELQYPNANTACCNENEWLVVAENDTLR